MAFGGKAPSAKGGARPRPPLIPKPSVEGFDKKEWIREYKMLKKDITYDERDRYRPLMCIKRDMGEFILECEKTEKKDTINLRREEDQQFAFIERQKQDVRNIKTLIGGNAAKTSDVDKIHQKVQTVEQNIKNFKLKSRAIYEKLHDEESQLQGELDALADKFESWE